jgi:hypothetical protein
MSLAMFLAAKDRFNEQAKPTPNRCTALRASVLHLLL